MINKVADILVTELQDLVLGRKLARAELLETEDENPMTRMSTGSFSGLLGLALVLTPIGRPQEPASTAPQAAASTTAQAAASTAPQSDASTTPQPEGKQEAPVVAMSQPATPVAPVAKGKKGEQVYTGPTTVVELPPTPMLDEEGKQRQDPDGKLMFNPPVRQQRDKKGHPLFDEQGKPMMQTKDNLGYDENGKKLHPLKEKPPKMVSVSISRGTLTVDGLIGKAALNYEIKDLKYVYFYVPGIGTTVVSLDAFPGAVEQKHAFDDKTLTVNVGEHVLQLSSDNRLLGKSAESAFVLVDKSFVVPTKFPVMGYGPIRVAPYAWPGSKINGDLKGAVEAPPLPVDLQPTLLLQPCPAGQMRLAGPRVLPGQTAPPQPCVPIVSSTAAPVSANQSTLLSGNAEIKK
jgi:hypothetical protein